MKKIFLFLSFSVLLLACSKDEPNNRKTGDQGNVTTGQSVFQVNKEDIEKVVTAFLKQPASSRQTGAVPTIVAIDSLKTGEELSRNAKGGYFPQNLLYFARLTDGSTVVLAADKRAEPVYAHFNNLELKFDKNGRLTAQADMPEPWLFLIGTAAASVLDKVETKTTVNAHWDVSKTSVSSADDEVQPSKCSVTWGQGYPLNMLSPASNGTYADWGRAAAGCVPIAIAQALTVLKADFTVFKGYELKTSWASLKTKKTNTAFWNQDEKDDMAHIVKRIAEHIGVSYQDNGSAGAYTKRAMDFFLRYLGGAYGRDENWDNVAPNMKDNSHGLSFLSGHEQSNGSLWKKLGLPISETSEHCMLLDGYIKKNGETLFYVNFGWSGKGNGYYLCDHKMWKENSQGQYGVQMQVYNFHLDTDYDDF